MCFYCMPCVARVTHGFLLNGVYRGSGFGDSQPSGRCRSCYRRDRSRAVDGGGGVGFRTGEWCMA